jgi:hypothetical protein
MSQRGRRLRRTLTNVALLGGTAVLGWFSAQAGLAWWKTGQTLDGLHEEQVRLTDENNQLRQLHADTQPKGFTICNKSAVNVVVQWAYASFPSGEHMRTFDSSRCEDWRPIEIDAGKSGLLQLNSPNEDCHWQGEVVFFAMQFEQPDLGLTQTVSGPWLGFEQDCFTIH